MKSTEARQLFLDGYREMMRRLKPTGVLFMGVVPEGCEGNIIRMPVFTDQIRKEPTQR